MRKSVLNPLRFTLNAFFMYDVIILGSGPAGLTSGIYAQRFGLKTVKGDLFSQFEIRNSGKVPAVGSHEC